MSISIGLGEICLINIFLMLRFGAVDKMKTANQTKPFGWARKWSDYIRTKCDFCGLWFFYWIGSVLNTPKSYSCGVSHIEYHYGYQYHTEQYQDINLVKKNLGDGEELGFGMMYGMVICRRKKTFPRLFEWSEPVA